MSIFLRIKKDDGEKMRNTMCMLSLVVAFEGRQT